MLPIIRSRSSPQAHVECGGLPPLSSAKLASRRVDPWHSAAHWLRRTNRRAVILSEVTRVLELPRFLRPRDAAEGSLFSS